MVDVCLSSFGHMNTTRTNMENAFFLLLLDGWRIRFCSGRRRIEYLRNVYLLLFYFLQCAATMLQCCPLLYIFAGASLCLAEWQQNRLKIIYLYAAWMWNIFILTLRICVDMQFIDCAVQIEEREKDSQFVWQCFWNRASIALAYYFFFINFLSLFCTYGWLKILRNLVIFSQLFCMVYVSICNIHRRHRATYNSINCGFDMTKWERWIDLTFAKSPRRRYTGLDKYIQSDKQQTHRHRPIEFQFNWPFFQTLFSFWVSGLHWFRIKIGACTLSVFHFPNDRGTDFYCNFHHGVCWMRTTTTEETEKQEIAGKWI